MYNKVNRVALYFSLTAALIIQLLFADSIKIAGAKPDLLVLMVVFFAIFFGTGEGFFSFLTGFPY